MYGMVSGTKDQNQLTPKAMLLQIVEKNHVNYVILLGFVHVRMVVKLLSNNTVKEVLVPIQTIIVKPKVVMDMNAV